MTIVTSKQLDKFVASVATLLPAEWRLIHALQEPYDVSLWCKERNLYLHFKRAASKTSRAELGIELPDHRLVRLQIPPSATPSSCAHTITQSLENADIWLR